MIFPPEFAGNSMLSVLGTEQSRCDIDAKSAKDSDTNAQKNHLPHRE